MNNNKSPKNNMKRKLSNLKYYSTWRMARTTSSEKQTRATSIIIAPGDRSPCFYYVSSGSYLFPIKWRNYKLILNRTRGLLHGRKILRPFSYLTPSWEKIFRETPTEGVSVPAGNFTSAGKFFRSSPFKFLPFKQNIAQATANVSSYKSDFKSRWFAGLKDFISLIGSRLSSLGKSSICLTLSFQILV